MTLAFRQVYFGILVLAERCRSRRDMSRSICIGLDEYRTVVAWHAYLDNEDRLEGHDACFLATVSRD